MGETGSATEDPAVDAGTGHSEIAQGTGASFKFYLLDKLTPPHKRSH